MTCPTCGKTRPPGQFKSKTKCIDCFKSTKTRAAKPAARLRVLKHNANKRSYEISVPDDELVALFQQDCLYCGRPSTSNEPNGVDRVDSARGYVTSNCVACCGPCNKMKYALDGRTFVERASHVSAHNGGPGAKYADSWSEPTRAPTVAKYSRDARKRGMAFSLRHDEFKHLTTSACTFCGRLPTAGKHNGIDRVDNAKGYDIDNCVTACGDCNIAKHTQTSTEFVERCKAIAARASMLWDQLPADMPRNVAILKKRHQPSRSNRCAECNTSSSPRWSLHPVSKATWVCRNCHRRLKRHGDE